MGHMSCWDFIVRERYSHAITMPQPIDPKPHAAAIKGAAVATRMKRKGLLWPAILIVILLTGCIGYLLSTRSDVLASWDGIWTRDLRAVAAVLIFAATYVVVAIGKLPGYRMDRAGAALLGGALMVGIGVMSPEEAYGAIDFDTIVLLLGMMIVVANLRVSGFFRIVSSWMATHVRRPAVLLVAVIMASGILSAFLVNDTICLVMTPLVLDLVLKLKRNPIPYLLAIAMASNIGSVATITGNPQNMIIGSLSHVPYGSFVARLAPIAVIGLVIAALLIALVYRREFITRERFAQRRMPSHYHGPLVATSVTVTAAMVMLFFLGQPVAKVAIVGGGFLLLTRRVNPAKIYREIDWPLLVMFIGLFIVVAALEKTVITPDVVTAIGHLRLGDTAILSAVTALLSNLVSNVPAVLVLKPFVAPLQDPQRAWLVIAMASTLAGNFTLLGSVANLIVAQRAKAEKIDLDFWSYFKIGAPLTVVTIVIGALLL
jgi:Na+/H+ antiporter NhaD/arsenite permease-like protein